MAVASVHFCRCGAVYCPPVEHGRTRRAHFDWPGTDAAGAGAGAGVSQRPDPGAGHQVAAGHTEQRLIAGDHGGRGAGRSVLLQPGHCAAHGHTRQHQCDPGGRGAGAGARRQSGQRPPGRIDHPERERGDAPGAPGQPGVQGRGNRHRGAVRRPLAPACAPGTGRCGDDRRAVSLELQPDRGRAFHRPDAACGPCRSTLAAPGATQRRRAPAPPRPFGARHPVRRTLLRSARGHAPGRYRGSHADGRARGDPEQRPPAGQRVAENGRGGGRALLGHQVLPDQNLTRRPERRGRPALDRHHQLHHQHGADR